MKVLDLFSGIGGFSLGLERAGMKTIAFCEIDQFCRKVLKKHWPDVPIHKDIYDLSAKDIPQTVDLICGGYPCQGESIAGKRGGNNDDRWLWPQYLRIIRELSPAWVLGENVAGHVSMGLDQVLSDLEDENYTWRTFIIPACAVDAPHRRDRVWIVANSNSTGCKTGGPGKPQKWKKKNSMPWNTNEHYQRHEWALTESPVCGADDGVLSRVDRIKGLGNAVVPQIPEIIGRAILEINR